MTQDSIKELHNIQRLDFTIATVDQQIAKLAQAPNADLNQRLLQHAERINHCQWPCIKSKQWQNDK
jgi:hypothetical protein